MAEVYRSAAIEAARMAGQDPEMDAAAARIVGRIQAAAAGHNRTGDFASSLEVIAVPGKRGVTDRLIVSSDPNAVSIEFGHLARDGTTFVDGLHLMARGAGLR
jgi:hypothetical protein